MLFVLRQRAHAFGGSLHYRKVPTAGAPRWVRSITQWNRASARVRHELAVGDFAL